MSAPRARLLRIGLVALLPLLALDGLLSLWLARDGTFLGHPVPPWGAITHPRQEEWLRGLEAEARGERRAGAGIGRFDPELGWSWRPSSASADGRFHIGALGARGPREYASRPPAGTRRILCFGDSFTFGDEIPDEATFEHLLEQRHPTWEVLDFGVSGYGTDQAWLRYRRIGRDLGADVVCIGIMLENIGRNVNRYRPLWNTRTGFCGAKPRFVLTRSGTLRLLPQPFATPLELVEAVRSGTVLERVAEHEYWLGPRIPTGRWSSLVRIGAAFLGELERSPKRLWSDPDGEPFRVTLAILEGFHREALTDGARAAPILVFPSRGALFDEALEGRAYWRTLLDELDRRNIPFIDTIPALVRKQREIERDPQGRSLYYGGHLTIVGNSVVADEIARWLSSNLQD